MHVEIASSADLVDLDNFLRDTWLECCGHLSDFRIDGRTYGDVDDEFGFDLDMQPMEEPKLDTLFREGLVFFHTYDYGSTTELRLQVLGSREGKPVPGKLIRLLARNLMPENKCVCGKEATSVCSFCLPERGCWVCDDCADEHDCDSGCGSEGLLPVMNSPRVGVCAYGAV